MTKCYCPSCGTINNPKNRKCMKCEAALRPYDKDFKKLFLDQVEGDVRGGIVSSILAFLQAHTYGMVLSITLVAVVVPNIVLSNIDSAHEVTSKPEVLLNTKTSTSGYASSGDLMNDFMKGLSSNGNIDRYLYENYFDVDSTVFNNRLDLFYQVIENENNKNEAYYLEYFKYHNYKNADQNEAYREGLGNTIDYHLIEEIDVLSVYVVRCIDAACTGYEAINNPPESPIDRFYFTFVKRDGEWYFYRISDSMAEALVDDTFYYYLKDGVATRYPSMKEAWEMQQSKLSE